MTTATTRSAGLCLRWSEYRREIPEDIREDVTDEDDAGQKRQIWTDGEEASDEADRDDRVTHQSPDSTDLTGLEDCFLVEEEDSGMAENVSGSPPATGIPRGDEEMVEVDEHTQRRSIADDENR